MSDHYFPWLNRVTAAKWSVPGAVARDQTHSTMTYVTPDTPLSPRRQPREKVATITVS